MSPFMAVLTATAVGISSLVPPATAGSFDPSRLTRIQRQGTAGPVRQTLAVGVSVHVPFQTMGGRSSLSEATYRFVLGWRPVAVTGMAPRTAGGIGRPLAQLSIRAADPDSFAINGVSVQTWRVLAAGEREGEDVDKRSRKKHSRMWWWIGGGVVFLGLLGAAGAAAAASAGKAAGRALACAFNPDPSCPDGGS